ncbi:uncharacterized protein LOC135057220 [Pseudophryne corroboree]|uniref:uncharacterized protein LOC135057220 n=1 Tax=Pseudophryne corroboree TaxID=495146 RepID=UPI0030819E8D
MWDVLKGLLDSNIHKFIPMGSKRRGIKIKPMWLNKKVKAEMDNKTRAFKAFIPNGKESFKFYKECNKKCKKAIRAAKIENEKLKKENIGPLKDKLGELINDDEIKAEILNKFFSSVFTKELMMGVEHNNCDSNDSWSVIKKLDCACASPERRGAGPARETSGSHRRVVCSVSRPAVHTERPSEAVFCFPVPSPSHLTQKRAPAPQAAALAFLSLLFGSHWVFLHCAALPHSSQSIQEGARLPEASRHTGRSTRRQHGEYASSCKETSHAQTAQHSTRHHRRLSRIHNIQITEVIWAHHSVDSPIVPVVAGVRLQKCAAWVGKMEPQIQRQDAVSYLASWNM